MIFRYLTAEEILRLHYQIIEDFGGSHGVRDEKRLLSVVKAPQLIVFGSEQYEGVHQKAAVYLRNIVGDHPFIDGNKRTGITVSSVFLARSGITLTVKPKVLEDFVVGVAAKHLDINEVATWLKNNSARYF